MAITLASLIPPLLITKLINSLSDLPVSPSSLDLDLEGTKLSRPQLLLVDNSRPRCLGPFRVSAYLHLTITACISPRAGRVK